MESNCNLVRMVPWVSTLRIAYSINQKWSSWLTTLSNIAMIQVSCILSLWTPVGVYRHLTYRYRSMSIPIPIPIISVSAIYSQGQYRYRPILCYYQCGADAKAAFFLITITVTGISMTERTHHAIFL